MKNDKKETELKEMILKRSIQSEVENMYKEYAIETIKERAIPNIVDGLKPVYRKALYTMWEMGLNHKVNRRKVNTIAGATLKYSVHGDVSVQGAVNGMTAWFKTNIPFIDGQGNFGSQIDHTAANGRYCVTGDVTVITNNMGIMTHIELAKLGNEQDADGYIDLTHLGMRVKGWNGEWVGCNRMIDSGVHYIYRIELEDGKTLTCTANHPVYTNNMLAKGWCRADRLVCGNVVYVLTDDNSFKEVMITGISILPEQKRVYSLVIDHPTHAYVTNGILSHNTEARLSEYTDNILLGDLVKESSIVPWSLNYDDTLYEPDVLPSKIPSLLVNGSPKGMAVGYASSHVPHNPIDVINTTIAYIENRDISIDDMVSIIKGPDFPTGGVINGMESVYRAYTTGKGSVLLRGKWKVREERGYQVVSIYEIPFGVTTSVILTGIAKLADEGKIKLVKGTLHDHSDINGINIEFFIKKDEDIDHVMNNILKNSELESRVPISAYVINNDNALKLATLKDIIVEFISAREEMLYNKFKEEIDIKNKRIHLLNGLVVISKDMDNAISLIRKSKGKTDAREKLMKKYKLDTDQADYILNMAVYRLSSMEIQSIIDDVKNLEKRVKELMAWTKTKSNKHIDKYMINEMNELKDTLFKNYKRHTKIQARYDHIDSDEIIRDEPITLVITKDGYVKKFQGHTINLDADIKSFGLVDGDEVYDIIRTSEAKTVCIVTDKSHVFGFKVHSLDFNKRGKLLRNIVMAKDNETVLSWWEHKTGEKYDVITVSDSGMMKSTQIDDSLLTSKGKLIMDVGRKGVLKAAIKSNSNKLLSIVTTHGQILTMNNNLRNTGIGGIGVIGIKLKDEDTVAGAAMFSDKISVVTRSGLYKTIGKSDLPIANRGGFGVIVYNNQNDNVIGVVDDTIERYVVRCGNGLFHDFYMGSSGKRNMKSRKIQLPSNLHINKIIQWG